MLYNQKNTAKHESRVGILLKFRGLIEVIEVQGEWQKPLEKLSQELDDLRKTLKSIDESKDQLRPELKRATGEVATLVKSKDSHIDPLYELPRILTAILENPKIGALVFGTRGERLLYNKRAQDLLGNLIDSTECGGDVVRQEYHAGFFTPGQEERPLQAGELPWNFTNTDGGAGQRESELLVKHPGQENVWLRVTVSPLSSSQPGKEPGGVIAFLADITEHVKVVNELSNICRDTEKRLDEFSKGIEDLANLANILAKAKKTDAPQPEKQPTEVSGETSKPASLGAGLKVLVVDDVAVNQKLLKLQLEKLGFIVELAGDGREACEKVKDSKPAFDLILMDCDMPKMDGYEATQLIRAQEGEKAVPIIAVTAYDREGDREKCLEAGMSDYITKGSPEKELQKLLSKWLKRETGEAEEEGKSGSIARSLLFDEGEILGDNFKQNQLDFAELARIYGQEEALEIIKLFLGVTGTFTECIDLALTSKDIEAVNHFAYSIKGPFSSLQLTSLSDLASKLPKLAAKHKWKDAKKVYGQLLELYKPIKSQMEEEIQKSTSTKN
ncbi:MAG: response regulator [Candidatus Obscuribacter sp.]|nr:response regulator [Candidatus Obscuribacter sp.]MBK9282068.1 response regulator [Candidatus Obscuribacter sp.]